MRYPMPNYPCEFEIPDDWLADVSEETLAQSAPAYRSTTAAKLVPLREIEPPYRSPGTTKDWRGFDRARLTSILKGIAAGAEIEPVPLFELPPADLLSQTSYRYRVRDGYHRFYASIAVGFECLPTMIS